VTTSPIETANESAHHPLSSNADTLPPLRIAYLVSQYPGVSHTFVLREVLALRERGIAIETASINDPPPTEKMTQAEQREAAQTFYVKRAGAMGLMKAIAWMLPRYPAGLVRGLFATARLGASDPSRLLLCLFYYAEAILLTRWIQQRSCSHLHVHFATEAATVGMILTRIVPVSMSMTVHGPDEFYDVPGYFLPQKVSACRFIVCISFFARSQLMRLAPGEAWQKFDIARLGVDSAHFIPRPRRASPVPFQILCVARLVPTKGQRVLIEAIGSLIDDGRAIQLCLIGDGPDRSSLERLVNDRGLARCISFEGSINQDRIRAFYEAADVFALASFAEGIPVVLMEAMSMEIPCIATRINGIPELIRDGIDGFLVAPSDSDAMAAAIARLMDDAALRDSFGKAGRLRIQDAYDLGKSADNLAGIFRCRLEEGDERVLTPGGESSR
jgi:glycosyltransferase involved in cell wall biosynthesis